MTQDKLDKLNLRKRELEAELTLLNLALANAEAGVDDFSMPDFVRDLFDDDDTKSTTPPSSESLEDDTIAEPVFKVPMPITKYTKIEDLPTLLSPRELSRVTPFGVDTIRRKCEEGSLPAKKVGRYWLISRDKYFAGLM